MCKQGQASTFTGTKYIISFSSYKVNDNLHVIHMQVYLSLYTTVASMADEVITGTPVLNDSQFLPSLKVINNLLLPNFTIFFFIN